MIDAKLLLLQICVSILFANGTLWNSCNLPEESVFFHNEGYCLLKKDWCHGEDEYSHYCPYNFNGCTDDQFQCNSNNMCIPEVGYCDGFISCPDGSDERNCPCDEQMEVNGVIDEQYWTGRHRSYHQCWKFVLKRNEQMTVFIKGKLYPRECKYGNVTLFVEGRYFFVGENKIEDSEYTICPVDMNKKNFTFFSNVEIRFTSYFPFEIDGTDELKITHNKINRDCLRPGMLMCSEISCVPSDKQCDGVKDCENGFDEENCGFVALSEEFFENSRKNASRWMRSHHDADWGWKENTASAVIALYLSNDLNLDTSSQEDELFAKQLELEVSAFLLRNKIEKSSVSELATYINALQAVCHNPRNFYGIDLVHQLNTEIKESTNVMPFLYLTLCNAKEIVSEEVIDGLIQILEEPSDFGFALEIQALASMALSCISNNDQYMHFKQNLTDHLNEIKKEQKKDGSFGNEYTTALIIQALIANDQAIDRDWEFKAAAEYLKKIQKLDGSFGDFLTTYLIMPALNGRSLVDLGRVNCSESQRRPRESNPVSDLRNRLGGKTPVKYSLVIGDEKDQMLPIFLSIPENITVLELMTLAADIDPKYKFKTHLMKEKTYVYEISSIPNDPLKNKFWIIYQEVGNDMEPTSQQSPDEIYIGSSYHIILWYRTLIQWHSKEKSSLLDIRQPSTIPFELI